MFSTTAMLCAGLLLAQADAGPAPQLDGAAALASRPTIGPLPALRMPRPERFTLKNGLKVLAVPRHTAPLVVARLVVDAGAVLDPAPQSGLASATADMLDEGAGTRGPLELARDLEALGASVSTSAGRDSANLSLQVPAKGLTAALGLAADIVTAPRFDPAEWRRVKNDRLTALLQRRDQARAVADVVGNRVLYGDAHPYGRPVDGYRRTVEGIELPQLVAFHAERWRPTAATLIVAGDYDPKRLRADLEQSFGRWQPPAGAKPAAARAASVAAPGPGKLPRFVLIDRPGAPQTVLRVVGPGVARRSAARPPLALVSTVLGGSFLSRLNANLREEKGYTYGAFGGFRFDRDAGAFDASADVFTKVTDAALKELLKEVALVDTAPITGDELTKARAIQLARLAENLATTGGTANVFADLAAHGEPIDAPERFMRALAKQSAKTVATATARHLAPDDLAIVVVGDRATIEAPLRALGLPAPELRDPDGEPIAPAAP